MIKIFAISWVVISLSLLAGCTSATLESEPLSYSLAAINKGVEIGMSMGIQGYSENHREYYSKPFQVIQPEAVMNAGYKDRGIAKVVVLGDSRPYTIEVEVHIERGKFNRGYLVGEYQFVRYDKSLAQKLLRQILTDVEHGDQDKNFIDDFRSF